MIYNNRPDCIYIMIQSYKCCVELSAMCSEISENIAAMVNGKREIILEHKKLRDLHENEVLLRISSVGICGSDIKYWAYGVCGRFELNGKNMVIGHEACGEVVNIGAEVIHLKPGDRVTIEPGVPCKACGHCGGGRYNLCHDMQFCATPPVDGNLCQYYIHDSEFCYKIPDNITNEEGALLEPLSVAVYACERGNIQIGQRVLIFGGGPIGILCGLVAKSQGASLVCIVDIDENRLQKSLDLGATDAVYKIDLKKYLSPREVSGAILKEIFKDDMPHVCLECSGADSNLVASIYLTMSGGSVVLVGRGSLNVNIPLTTAAVREIDIKGIFRYAKNNYAQALSLVASGAIDVKRLITHRFSLKEAQKAFEIASDPKQQSIKVMLHCK